MDFNVDDYSFKKEIGNSNILTIVNFWAPWCRPCNLISPIWTEISHDYNGLLKIIRINTDKNPTTAMEYSIRSIPTILIFRKGELLTKITGAVPKSTIIQTLEQLL
uniref:thioredoxin n=1 Tax=Rhodaphanes brevistipitata TaxID=446136 RepID=UPI001FCE0401|nr:thioredoxin [Rhodaphanes brevistipitata]UNJ18387.1 thioredoxin [Rhodaphanes brevistipitata]